MKTNLTGMDAFYQMLEAQVPEKTDSYTPIAHMKVFQHIRAEIKSSGFIIAGEDYKCTDKRTYRGVETEGGQVAIGMVKIKYGKDPDLLLTCAFLNSYNKQFAFRFALGANVTANGNSLMLENNFKRVHTGEADIWTTGTISQLIKDTGEHWDELVARKDKMKTLALSSVLVHDVLGHLYFEQDILTGYQMNIIKKELARLRESGVTSPTAWQLYNVVAEGIKDTHPAEWLDVHTRTSEVFNAVLDLDGKHVVIPAAVSSSTPVEEEESESFEGDDEPLPAYDYEDSEDEVA